MSAENRPAFFVPKFSTEEHEVPLEEQERRYIEFGRLIGRGAPEPGKRVYSITYVHDGEIWTATVGQRLSGKATRVSRSRGKKIERAVLLSNGSTAMAIFPGVPFHVWHDGASKVWANPFLAGEPLSITYFVG